MDRLFTYIYRNLVCRKPLFYVLVTLLFAVLILTAFKIRFVEDITGLIPENEKTARIQEVLHATNFADKIIVNIKSGPEGAPEDLSRYASRFLDSLQSHSGVYVKRVQGRIDDEDISRTLDLIYHNLPLFLDPGDYPRLKDKIGRDSIEAITLKNYKALASPTGTVAKTHILRDPLKLSFVALEKLRQLHVGDDFTIHDGFLFSKDKKNLLLFITPAFGANETAKNESLVRNLYRVKDELDHDFGDRATAQYLGAPLVAVANARQIKRDIQLTVGIVSVLLLLILISFYRKPGTPVVLFIPTLFGGLLALAFLYLLRERISAISLGIGSVLLGITLDYSLHILTHLRNNNDVKALYQESLKPVLMSSLTTALAFLCLLLLRSQALQDLGIFVAVSVLGASSFALLFIPGVYAGKTAGGARNTLPDRMAKYPLHKKKWARAGLAILLLISLFTHNRVQFNHDITRLNYEPEAVKKAQQQLESFTDITTKSVYVIAYSPSEQQALETNDRIYARLKQLEAKGQVRSFSSAGIFLPSEKARRESMARWNAFWNEKTVAETKGRLVESGSKLGFRPMAFEPFFTLLEKDFTSLQTTGFSGPDFFPAEDFISRKDGLTTVSSIVKAEENRIPDIFRAFANEPGVLVIDRQQVNEAFLGDLKNDFNRLIGYSLLVIVLLLLAFFRSFSLTLVTCIPICLTWLLTIGIMGLFRMEFNIFNVIISTFVFGLGIDYSIFMTNGLLTYYSTGEKTVSTYKTSILLSVITTVLGVGALIFAKHPALHSIALVSVIGILSAVFVAFTVQPMLFRLFVGSRTKRPVTPRLLVHSTLSFLYFGMGGVLLSLFGTTLVRLIPMSKKVKMRWFHRVISKHMRSVLYTNPFVKKKIINSHGETFEKPGLVIANHTSFLDILALGMLHPNMIFLVNDWVYRSPVFGKIAQLAGFYPVSGGIEKGVDHLRQKVEQGYSLIVFPEGTRSYTNRIKRFHKGAFYLSEKLELDLIPVLIHGNSEVLPKGDHIIRDGSITLKILERIPYGNQRLGKNYTQKTKYIGRYFRDEFRKFREETESSTYFHPLVLETYKYKDRLIYGKVKKDLKANVETYARILENTDKKGDIVHLSEDFGQLDLLLALDVPDRKLLTHIKNDRVRAIICNSYTAYHRKISFAGTVEEALEHPSHSLILHARHLSQVSPEKLVQNGTNTLILRKETRPPLPGPCPPGFVKRYEDVYLLIFQKEG